MRFEQDDALDHWETCRPWLDEACTYGDGWWSIEFAEDVLRSGRGVLWVLLEDDEPVAAIMTALAQSEDGLSAEIVLAGGSGVLAEIDGILEQIEAWARAHGADNVVVRGRRGWAKAMRSFGYDEVAVTMRKGLAP